MTILLKTTPAGMLQLDSSNASFALSVNVAPFEIWPENRVSNGTKLASACGQEVLGFTTAETFMLYTCTTSEQAAKTLLKHMVAACAVVVGVPVQPRKDRMEESEIPGFEGIFETKREKKKKSEKAKKEVRFENQHKLQAFFRV